MKKTVVIGASDNPERYAYKATLALQQHHHEVIPVGLRNGTINGIAIYKGFPKVSNVDTVTLYVGLVNQSFWYDYILNLKPKRVIFNPSTGNPDFEKQLIEKNIEVEHACTLVLLATKNY